MQQKSENAAQLTLDFDPGVRERFPQFEDTLVHVVYSGLKPQKSIAYDIDESPSSLARKVKGDLAFPAHKLPDLIRSTEDLTPLYWLIEEFLGEDAGDRDETMAEVERHMAAIQALMDKQKRRR